ncbi:phosphopantetheine-binding protein [Paenibacillus sp. N3/727]|uniref:beta-ketoacyl synthase N-terminal-like domain-containing protein n=1 Tax=Paenibacillus sp. N3/727 TaxID=2925845 RepID=UPI001F534064|nr:beta-ketoacyl synthase N-terminal-like domain-containing protein [Paenibacillus sp. N3/727]UNK15974.1 phosphopantetheine-binding protein [Paenibacillus sp. N3/727]
MDKLVSQIFEQVAKGQLDEKAALQLLRTLKEQQPNESKDIAIIGLSLKMPGADNIQQFWDNLEQGCDFIGPLSENRQQDSLGFIRTFTQLQEDSIHFSHGGFMQDIDKFDYAFFNLSPKEAALMDPNQRLFLQTAWEAIEDAGYGGRRIQGSKTGVYIGYADWPVYGQYITKNQPSQIPMASTGNTPSIIAGRIAYLLDLQGPALLVDTACSSSLVAVHLACMALRNAECEMAIAGGVKVCLMPVDGLFEIGIESSNRRTSAFDDSSDGTVWGEGTVALLLKPLSQAIRDKDPIHAVIRGSAINQDGTSVGLTAPNAASQEKLLMRAWKDAGIHPETIGYIEAHGTGTKLGDPIEVDGIRRAFRHYTNRKQFCAIGSVKTNVGHLDAASGVAGLAKAIASLKYKKLPPTLHFTRPNRNIPFENSPLYVNDRLEPWETNGEHPRRCGVSSFGFSGTNCHLVLEEAPIGMPNASQADTNRDDQLMVLSAKSRSALERQIQAYVRELPELEGSFSDLCYTAHTGRGHYSCRLAIIASGIPSLMDKLYALLEVGLEQQVEETAEKGVFYNEYRIASGRREKRQRGEWTLDELKARSEAANELIHQADSDGGLDKHLLEQLAQFYVQGADVNWEVLYKGQPYSKLHLPVYSFEPSRCWIDPSADTYMARSMPTVVESNKETDMKLSASLKSSAAEHVPILKGRADENFTSTEIRLAALWGDLLGVKEINIDDDFFELGGNSILTIRVEVELEQAGILFTSELLYRYSTIREAAVYLEQQSSESGNSHETSSFSDSTVVTGPLEEAASEGNDIDQAAVTLKLEQGIRSSEGAEYDLHEAGESVILPNIEPFNDLYYRNCFYNSFFPVVKHFGGSILPYLVNDLLLYHRTDTEEAQGYELRYEEVEPQETLFTEMNLSVQTEYDFGDIKSKLIQSISQGNPAIVWVDCYEIPSRSDAYQKQHVDHTLLVYGFDEGTQMFHIIEHDRRENLSYKPCLIVFDDLVRACIGYETYYQPLEHRAAYYIIQHYPNAPHREPELNELKQRFESNLTYNRHRLQESMDVLQQFAAWFIDASSNEASLKQHAESMIETLNQILNAKQVEGYRLTALYGEDASLLATHRECVEYWETIRKGIVRFFYAPVYQGARIEAIQARLERLLATEQQFLSQLFHELQLI